MGNTFSESGFERFFVEKHDDFPPDFGFKAPRKPRVMKISEEEMKALKIPPINRDYCAHLLKDIYMCRRDNAPFYWKCKHENHTYFQCQVDDYILGLKEIERNRRLKLREKKKREIA